MKIIVCITVAVMLLSVGVLAADEFSLDELIENAPSEVNENVTNAKDAKNLLNITEIINFITGNIITSIKENIGLVCSMVGVMIIMGVFDIMQDSFSNTNTSKIADFACTSLIAVLVCSPLAKVIEEIVLAVTDTASYIQLSVPVFAGILTAQGNVTSASIFNLLLYNGAAIIAKLFSSLAMPLCGTYMAVGIAASVSGNSGIGAITAGVKNVVNKIIVAVSTLFTGLLSLQNLLGRSGDMLSKKALKMAVGSALPVGGSVLSESVDAFWESLSIIKSAGGVIAIAAIFYLIAVPVIKALVGNICIRLCVFIGNIVGSSRAGTLLNVVADAYSMILTAAFAVMVILTISVGVLISAGGAV